MADYYPLLARAISALPENNGEARRTVYERARSALLAQLRGADPPLPDEEVTRERLALEEAVRRVETEYSAMAAASTGGLRVAATPAAERVVVPEPSHAPPRPSPAAATTGPARAEPPHEAAAEPAPGMIRSGLAPRGDGRIRPSEPPAAAPRGEEMRAERERPPARETARPRPAPRSTVEEEEPASRGGRWGRLVLLLVVLLVVGGAAALGYTQREHIIAMIRDMRAGSSAPPQEAQKPATPEVPKSTDRIAQAAPDTTRRAAPQATTSGPQAMVAQRAVMFEENPGGGQQGLQQFVGTVVWKAENFDPGNGRQPDLGIRGTVEIPDRQFKVEFTIRRNQDASLPASHIIEIQFDLPQNFDLGNVANVPGLRAKASESAQGLPLIGLAVRVTPGFFLVGLSAQEMDRQRNLGLLITRNWLDLPMVFSNGRRGILALEKGVPGDQVFRQAYAAWGLPVPPEQPAQQ
ncbi:MAG: hypothetical protein K0R27_1614 [Xanthobacteraceae bacterium]|jgi:hypothetical protein|nr:hypothetical protein [Xanthobacteraceae bacterium]